MQVTSLLPYGLHVPEEQRQAALAFFASLIYPEPVRLKTLALGGLWRGDADVWLRRNEEWLLPVLALNSQPAKQALALLPHLDECRIHAEEIFAVRSRLSRYGHFCSPNQQAWADARRAAWLKHNDSVLRQLELTTTCREFELLLAQLEDPHE